MCLLMRKETFDAIDGYDEKLAVGFGDVDLCLRTLQLGWRVLYCPQATLVHHESITRGKAEGYDPPRRLSLFASRWRDFLDQGDPYFHPHLKCATPAGWYARPCIVRPRSTAGSLAAAAWASACSA
ncbi:glycosyltransferase family 2 protein [Comamonas sp. JC664]|uniref:glycosyltransferase family 2 protein n=1 Tax=Comamonas sp. JC664 TaxID=2801917 RepID=UPI00361F370C